MEFGLNSEILKHLFGRRVVLMTMLVPQNIDIRADRWELFAYNISSETLPIANFNIACLVYKNYNSSVSKILFQTWKSLTRHNFNPLAWLWSKFNIFAVRLIGMLVQACFKSTGSEVSTQYIKAPIPGQNCFCSFRHHKYKNAYMQLEGITKKLKAKNSCSKVRHVLLNLSLTTKNSQ